MATYTSQYNISIGKLVGRLLPYFARGRRLFYLLCGSLGPLKSLHDSFITWAQEKHFEARLSFQVMSLKWYLTKTLKDYFATSTDEFIIDLYAHKKYDVWLDTYANKDGDNHTDSAVYHTSERYDSDVNVYVSEDGDNNIIFYRNEVTGSTVNRFNIGAPALQDASKEEEYINAIKKIIAKYSLIRKYTIIIMD